MASAARRSPLARTLEQRSKLEKRGTYNSRAIAEEWVALRAVSSDNVLGAEPYSVPFPVKCETSPGGTSPGAFS